MKFAAICLKEIFWDGKTYIRGSNIILNYNDLQILRQAGTIGDIKQISEKEFAVKEAPETAMKSHGGKSRSNQRNKKSDNGELKNG